MSEDFKTKHMFSLNEEYPLTWNELPNRIRLSNGDTRTDKETFTESELKDAGYVFTDVYPNYNDETHVCNWTGTEWEITQFEIADEKHPEKVLPIES